MDRGQAMVAGAGLVAAVVFQVIQESAHQRRVDIVDRQRRRLSWLRRLLEAALERVELQPVTGGDVRACLIAHRHHLVACSTQSDGERYQRKDVAGAAVAGQRNPHRPAPWFAVSNGAH